MSILDEEDEIECLEDWDSYGDPVNVENFPELYHYNSDKKYKDEQFTRSVVYKNEIYLCNDIFCLKYVKIHKFILFFFPQWL